MQAPRSARSATWAGALLLAAALLPAQADEPPPAPVPAPAPAPETPAAAEAKPALGDLAYLDSVALAARLAAAEQVGRQAGLQVALTQYGRSAADQPLLALWVGGSTSNPQVLVHGGLGANDAAGTVACLDLAERLVAGEGADALRRVSFVLIPAPNPDALDAFLRGAPRAGGGALDRDRDGARGEDGPDDLDGDGEVRQMRRRSPRGTWALGSEVGREGTPERDPRLLLERGLDPQRAASYEVLDEGRDDDGDGLLGEDPPGIDLTRQLAGFWDHQGLWGGDGGFAGEAPEARALMELSYAQSGLIAWYGFRSEGPFLLRASEHGALADADTPLYDKLGAALHKLTGVELRRASERAGGRNPGSDLDWASTHLGVLALALPVWRIAKQGAHKAERPCADELDWLLWNDAALAGAGWAPWTPFAHPTLGAVEIGGWKRFTRREPPPPLLTEAVRGVSMAPLGHAAFTPALALDLEVLDRGAGLFELKARARNAGAVASATALAVARQRAHGVRLTLELEEGVELLAGPAFLDVGVLAAGASSGEQAWLLRRVPPRVNRVPDRLLAALAARHPACPTVRAEVLAP